MHSACSRGDVNRVRVLLQAGADVNERHLSPLGLTPLHRAAARQEGESLVRMLLNAGADVSATDEAGYTALHWSALCGRAEAAQLLVDRGAQVDCLGLQGETPLRLAAEHGHVSVLRVLLSAGARTDLRPALPFRPLGPTAYEAAEKSKHVEAMSVLNAATEQLDDDEKGQSSRGGASGPALAAAAAADADAADASAADVVRAGPLLHTMVRDDELSKVRSLLYEDRQRAFRLDAAQRPPLFAARSADMCALLLSAGARIDSVDKYGQNIVHSCVCDNNAAVLAAVVGAAIAEDRKHGLGSRLHQHLVTAQDKAGKTPLHWARSAPVAKTLLAAVESEPALALRLLHTRCRATGNVPLHYAAQSGRVAVCRVLMSAEARYIGARKESHWRRKGGAQRHAVSMPNACGKSPMHLAAEEGHNAVLCALLESPAAKVSAADAGGWTPLHYACLGSYPQFESRYGCIDILLEAGADVHIADSNGWTALHHCTDSPAARTLLRHGADKNARDLDGRSPLFFCSSEITTVLVEAGADVLFTDVHGRTALHYATEAHKAESLLHAGVPVNAPDKKGWTPLDWALIRADAEDIASVLRKAGGHGSQAFAESAEGKAAQSKDSALRDAVKQDTWRFGPAAYRVQTVSARVEGKFNAGPAGSVRASASIAGLRRVADSQKGASSGKAGEEGKVREREKRSVVEGKVGVGSKKSVAGGGGGRKAGEAEEETPVELFPREAAPASGAGRVIPRPLCLRSGQVQGGKKRCCAVM